MSRHKEANVSDYNEVDQACAKFLEETPHTIGRIELGVENWVALRASVNGAIHIKINDDGSYSYCGVPLVLVPDRNHLKVMT